MTIKPEAVIMDIDGTLLDVRPFEHHFGRPEGFDADAYDRDILTASTNREAEEFLIKNHAAGRAVLVFTARKERYRDSSYAWLRRVSPVPLHGVFHRADGDDRHDVAIKHEMYLRASKFFTVVAAMDDHPGVVYMWRDLGIPEVIQTEYTTYTDPRHLDKAVAAWNTLRKDVR